MKSLLLDINMLIRFFRSDRKIAACVMDAGATLISSDAHFATIPLLDMHIVE